ncbi:MAG: hypothetical protein Q9226_000010 [Calogaya cf. arnoldii]
MPLPTMQARQSLRPYSQSPLGRPRLRIEEQSTIPQPTLDPPEFMKLIDLSLRHTIGGINLKSRDSKRPSEDAADIQLIQALSDISLADISPALFRPGYMKAISQRAHLISHISSSISSICSRLRTRHQCASDSVTASSSKLLGLVKPSQLQTRLWHLLQKRKWPTEPLEPLGDSTMLSCNQYKRDRELILDSDELEKEVQRRETDDDTILDIDRQFADTMDEDDDDLFSSYERTPFSSQDTVSLEMMLESDEDEELMLEDDVLLLSEGFGEHQPPAYHGERRFNFTKMREGAAWIEDTEFELLEYGNGDGEDIASMMLL